MLGVVSSSHAKTAHVQVPKLSHSHGFVCQLLRLILHSHYHILYLSAKINRHQAIHSQRESTLPPSPPPSAHPTSSKLIMSQHARIEELSDTDSDPPEQDPDDFTDTLIRPAANPPPPSHRAPPSRQPRQPQPQPPPSFNPPQPPEHKHYQCLYPLYFDANKTRSEGRRVSASQAVQNPLAREIVDAVQLLGLKTVFEPGKTHPRDWANPGRVRVLVKEGGRARNARVKNSTACFLVSFTPRSCRRRV